MGIWICGIGEIEGKLMDLLDNLEGEVYEKDFKKACENAIKRYKYFSK